MGNPKQKDRRSFLKEVMFGGVSLSLPFNEGSKKQSFYGDKTSFEKTIFSDRARVFLDLSPAKWIWFPSRRCLPNTFVFFRREFTLRDLPDIVNGWILAESRYILYINGNRVQWGPAPSDPRYSEADPLAEVQKFLKRGKNVIGIQCLFYGHGDGTWPIGKPGLIFKLILGFKESQILITSDSEWYSKLGTCWKLGTYKRWFLRALQEEKDNRSFPLNWNKNEFILDGSWFPALEIGGDSSRPAINCNYDSYDLQIGGNNQSYIKPRSIPLMKEGDFLAKDVSYVVRVKWKTGIKEYFDYNIPDAFKIGETLDYRMSKNALTLDQVQLEPEESILITFEWAEQGVGWPYFSIKTSEGTVIEALVHEAHDPAHPQLFNTHFNSWSRFICKEGWNYFKPMDFESFRWLQLNIYNFENAIEIKQVGMLRRRFSWPNLSKIEVGDKDIQKIIKASLNTLDNCAQDIIVDGMARERQQYSGDGSHQLHAIYSSKGEFDLPARFINTFGKGSTLDGYFFDSWPAYDRLARVMERQLGLTGWGPILDHSVGFCFDCWFYYLYTDNLERITEILPNLIRFFEYLRSSIDSSGLLPVEDLGLPSVWMDHVAFNSQRNKQCAFNLYCSAMCTHALPPLLKEVDKYLSKEIFDFGLLILNKTISRFWDKNSGVFVNNLPWAKNNPSFDDRSLATSIIFDQCPDGEVDKTLKILKSEPGNLGISYPANSIWRYWALIKGRRINKVLDDLRLRWTNMQSIDLNNTIQEDWSAKPDSGSLWSHCAVSPQIIMHMGVAGISPLAPGYSKCRVEPQFGDLDSVEIRTYTVKGPIDLQMKGVLGNRHVSYKTPKGIESHIIVDEREADPFLKNGEKFKKGLKKIIINGERDMELVFQLRYS